MNVSWPLHKLAQDPHRFWDILEPMSAKNRLPFALRFREFTGKGGLNFYRWHFGAENFLKNSAYLPCVTFILNFEGFQSWESHQSRESFTGVVLSRNGVRLAIALHLEAMFDVAKKAISFGQTSSVG